jgi:hypothetical protein
MAWWPLTEKNQLSMLTSQHKYQLSHPATGVRLKDMKHASSRALTRQDS